MPGKTVKQLRADRKAMEREARNASFFRQCDGYGGCILVFFALLIIVGLLIGYFAV